MTTTAATARAARRRLLPSRGRLVAVQAALACAATGVAHGGPWGHALTAAGGVLLVLALLRRRGQWGDQRVRQALAREAFSVAPAGATARPRPAEEDLGLVHALLPALDVRAVADRNGPDVGVLADGRGHAAVLEFPGGVLPSLPAGLIADWLAEDRARPAAAQLLVEQFGLPPWDFHYRYQPTVAYRQLPAGRRPVAVRSWLVVRYEPWEAPEAAERRGGGAAGAGAAVVAATARLRARLAAQGAEATPLGPEAARALLRQIGDASGQGRALHDSWAGNTATHCTVTVSLRSQADWTRLLSGLSGCAAERVVAATTLTREGQDVRLRSAVRLVSSVAQHAAAERDRLVQAGLVGPSAADQAAGLLATLPVAHPARTLVEATGFAMTAGDR